MNKKRIIEIIKALFILVLFFSTGYIEGILALLLHLKLNPYHQIILIILADLITVTIIYLLYSKDLKREWKIFKTKFSICFDSGLKYWLLGLGIMVSSNILIGILTPLQNSENEIAVQSLIPISPFLMLLAAGIFAPFIEEITFRKTLRGIFKKKWIFAFSSFFLFGLVHVIGAHNPLEYLYIIPYGALGFTFALAYDETDTVFTSIMMHAIHNTLLILLSLLQ